jgi:protein subunit release factor A
MGDEAKFTGTLTIEVYPPRPTGGQICGPGPQGIKITHQPSGIVAIVDCERSQHRNKALAAEMIEAALTNPNYRGVI